MKKFTLVLLSLAAYVVTFAQKVYDPQILILSPNVITYDSALAHEIIAYNRQMSAQTRRIAAGQDSLLRTNLFTANTENLRTIVHHETSYLKNMDFFNQISLMAEQYLTFRFYEHFPNMLIVIKDIKSKWSVDELRVLSIEEGLQYVLNFPSVSIHKNKGTSSAEITVQLYDREKRKLVLDKKYTGNRTNSNVNFPCYQNSLTCTFSDALGQALPEIIRVIAGESPTLKNKQQLFEERSEILMKNFYANTLHLDFVREIIGVDSKVNLNGLYQGVVNDDKTKFVAFFLEEAQTDTRPEASSGQKNKQQNNDNGIRLYAYLVKGVRHNHIWFYERANITFFHAGNIVEGRHVFFNHLQQWNFFKQYSAEVNPEFWQAELFEKVDELSSPQPDDADYIGLYKIVANHFKKIRKEEEEKFKRELTQEIFIPFFNNQVAASATGFSDYKLFNERLVLIYPKAKNVILNPVMVINEQGKRTLRYFVFLPDRQKIYEWTYFPARELDENTVYYGSEIVDQLEQLTTWHFGFITLDDPSFWNQYVLMKSGDGFAYLKELQ